MTGGRRSWLFLLDWNRIVEEPKFSLAQLPLAWDAEESPRLILDYGSVESGADFGECVRVGCREELTSEIMERIENISRYKPRDDLGR
jgi:hypothetical protein